MLDSLRKLSVTLYVAIPNSIRKRMGKNVLAILRYLSSDASPLASSTTGYTRPTSLLLRIWLVHPISVYNCPPDVRHAIRPLPFASLVRPSRESSWLSLALQNTDNHRRLLDGSMEWRPRAHRRQWRSTDRREWACGHNASYPWP